MKKLEYFLVAWYSQWMEVGLYIFIKYYHYKVDLECKDRQYTFIVWKYEQARCSFMDYYSDQIGAIWKRMKEYRMHENCFKKYLNKNFFLSNFNSSRSSLNVTGLVVDEFDSLVYRGFDFKRIQCSPTTIICFLFGNLMQTMIEEQKQLFTYFLLERWRHLNHGMMLLCIIWNM